MNGHQNGKGLKTKPGDCLEQALVVSREPVRATQRAEAVLPT